MAGNKKTALKNLPKGGRRKGSKNQFTELKDAFLQAFDGIGAAKELEKWGKVEKLKKKSSWGGKRKNSGRPSC